MTTPQFYVYGYFDVTDTTGNPFYIGKGTGNRHISHFNDCKRGRTLFHCKLRSMMAEGNRPAVRILRAGLEDAEAVRLEIELIAKYGRRDLGTGCLCNHTGGGEGQVGRLMSLETRHRISETKKAAMREPTIDERIRISRAHSGRKETRETRLRKRESRLDCLAVCSYDLRTGETVKTYPSVSSVKEDGFQYPNVHKVIHGLRSQHGGLGWRLA
jgi:hypothetical protein